MSGDNAWDRFKAKLDQYLHPEAAKRWFEANFASIRELFTNQTLLEFIFEPVRDVFVLRGDSVEDEIRAAITRVALVNAVLAGLPGKMGVGVMVSMALEAWMAYSIATRVGVKISKPVDVFKYFSLLAGTVVAILWGFKTLLSFGFSMFGFLGPINPLIPAELLVTNLIGVLFWFGFDEVKNDGSFTVPKRAIGKIVTETKGLFDFQWGILKKVLTPENWKLIAARTVVWFKGEIPRDKPLLRGELFATVAMAWLLSGKTDELRGPLAEEFIGAIRDRYPDLASATENEIAEHMASYDGDQIIGVINLIKGKMFERLVERHENADGDQWMAYLHDDESYPGSDITFHNYETGELIEVSLKATGNSAYIEEALRRYPDIPIMTTEEVAQAFPGNDHIFASHLSNSDLETVTAQNYEILLEELTPVDAVDVATAGPAMAAGIGLWPFVVAYLKKRISYEQLERACIRVAGEAGEALAARLSYAVLLGPVFAWYLLARGVILVTKGAEEIGVASRKLVWSPGDDER